MLLRLFLQLEHDQIQAEFSRLYENNYISIKKILHNPLKRRPLK